MEFGFTKEQEGFRQQLRHFCETEPWGEIADPNETTGNYSPSFYRKVAEKSWLGLSWPKEYGGQSLGPIFQSIFYEEMAYIGAPVGLLSCGLNASMCVYIVKEGTEQQKKEFLSRVASADITWIGEAFTEPEAACDLAAVQTFAVREGDEYVINGQKTFCSIAHRKGLNIHLLLMAKTQHEAPPGKGIGLFLVPINTAGISLTPLYTIGHIRTNQVYFDNVRVPKQNLVGEENKGFDYYRQYQYLIWARNPGVHPGTLRRILEALIQYVKTTKIDGCLLSEIPWVRQKVADLATDIEILRLLCYKTAWAQSKDKDVHLNVAIQSVFEDELLARFPDVGMQIVGLYGQLNAQSKHAVLQGMMEKLYRDMALCLFWNSGVLTRKNFIASQGLGLPMVGREQY